LTYKEDLKHLLFIYLIGQNLNQRPAPTQPTSLPPETRSMANPSSLHRMFPWREI